MLVSAFARPQSTYSNVTVFVECLGVVLAVETVTLVLTASCMPLLSLHCLLGLLSSKSCGQRAVSGAPESKGSTGRLSVAAFSVLAKEK